MTTSLELSMEIDKRGVRIDTMFYSIPRSTLEKNPEYKLSIKFRHDKCVFYAELDSLHDLIPQQRLPSNVIPRPTTDELLEVMPNPIIEDEAKGIYYFPELTSFMPLYNWTFRFHNADKRGKLVNNLDLNDFADNNPANAVASCLIYLIDNNYCTVRDGEVVVNE